MNVDRLVRDIVRRLEVLPEQELSLVQDVIHEELARDQRYRTRELTVESERERREEAEGLREAIDAVNRSLRLDETAEEVLKQVDRLAPADVAEVAMADAQANFRVVGMRQEDEFTPGLGRRLPRELAQILAQRGWCSDASSSPSGEPLCDPGGLLSAMASWCALPLILEGEVVGGLLLGGAREGAFDETAVHRVRALAFSAAAALQRAHRHEQVRLYSALLEQVIEVQQGAMAGAPPLEVARAILVGALRLGEHPAGLLVLEVDGRPTIAAVTGFSGDLEGRPAPAALCAEAASRLEGEALAPVTAQLGLPGELTSLFLVPVAAGGTQVGCLAVADPDGETPDDRLLEAYTSRACIAYQFALSRH